MKFKRIYSIIIANMGGELFANKAVMKKNLRLTSNFHACAISRFLPIFLLVTFFILNFDAYSQGLKAEVSSGKIDIEIMKTPKYSPSGGKSKAWQPKNWIEFVAPISLSTGDSSRDKIGFVDELMVKFYVRVRTKPVDSILETSVVYGNVPLGEELLVSSYLSPNSVQKLFGNSNATPSDFVDFAVELYYKGVIVAVGGKKWRQGQPVWWKSPSARRLQNLLLQKKDTPFHLLWWDLYADIKRKE